MNYKGFVISREDALRYRTQWPTDIKDMMAYDGGAEFKPPPPRARQLPDINPPSPGPGSFDMDRDGPAQAAPTVVFFGTANRFSRGAIGGIGAGVGGGGISAVADTALVPQRKQQQQQQQQHATKHKSMSPAKQRNIERIRAALKLSGPGPGAYGSPGGGVGDSAGGEGGGRGSQLLPSVNSPLFSQLARDTPLSTCQGVDAAIAHARALPDTGGYNPHAPRSEHEGGRIYWQDPAREAEMRRCERRWKIGTGDGDKRDHGAVFPGSADDGSAAERAERRRRALHRKRRRTRSLQQQRRRRQQQQQEQEEGGGEEEQHQLRGDAGNANAPCGIEEHGNVEAAAAVLQKKRATAAAATKPPPRERRVTLLVRNDAHKQKQVMLQLSKATLADLRRAVCAKFKLAPVEARHFALLRVSHAEQPTLDGDGSVRLTRLGLQDNELLLWKRLA